MGDLDIHALFQDRELVEGALRLAARDALIKHKALGVPIAIWRDNRVVIVPPEEIEIPEIE
ncbi:MAG: hypothetical protein AB1758_16860 [Candidatus Eremiobacterota bacterium]